MTRPKLDETIGAILAAVQAMDPDDGYAVAAVMSRTAARLYGQDGHADAFLRMAEQHARLEQKAFRARLLNDQRAADFAEQRAVEVPAPFVTVVASAEREPGWAKHVSPRVPPHVPPSERTKDLCAAIDHVREVRASLRGPSARATR